MVTITGNKLVEIQGPCIGIWSLRVNLVLEDRMPWFGPDVGWIGKSLERLLAGADSANARMMASPLMQRWLVLNEGYLTAASEARLATGMANLRNATLLVGAAELVVTLGVPIAVWIGVFVALGAPYAEACCVADICTCCS